MRLKYFFYVMFVLFFNSCSSCDSIGKEKCKKNVSFEINMTLTPQLDTFSLGDTIWVESTINKKMFDLVSGDSIAVDSFDFRIFSSVNKVLDTMRFYEAENSFDYLNAKGKFIVLTFSNVSKAQLLYKKENHGQSIRFGMIPREIGNFDIGFYNLRENFEDVDFPEDCQINITDIKYRMNEGENNNYHLIDSFYHAIYSNSNFNENDFNHDGGYAFVVIE